MLYADDNTARIKLYEEVRILRGQGLSYSRIIGLVRERYSIKLRKSAISEWVRGIHSPYNGSYIPSIEFLKPSEELAYIIGAVAGDGYVRRRQLPRKSYRDVITGLMVKDREFAEEFSTCIAVVLKREPA